ncbi:thermonuclease family protein [Desulfobacter postgatei]|uniref:thermonuclease family protein n=1 Tax=Desulfobacter postgatei TaxID=2293 RepID=UPI00259B99EF|nr:thermonuclease family protein [uncultured Desulfobacter sp.]
MKKAIITALTIFCFIALPAIAGQYQVLNIVDGDTVDILYMGQKERVRLLCVDTPESVHPDQTKNCELGKQASAYTKSRLTGKTVDLEFESTLRGKYGRLLAYIILDGKNFNVELVREGWSPYYTKYGTSDHHHADFVSAEKYAKAQGKNIWAAGEEEAPTPAPASQYHGNVKSLKFHRPGCQNYDCKNCTRIFESREEAISAGYAPCGLCKP